VFAPERAHLAYAYLEEGLRIIPCEVGGKPPSHVLPGQRWKPYQDRAPTEAEIEDWLRADPDCNWGLICGGGLYNADADDLALARWLLANPNHPVLRGATVHRSGRGKAHLFFRTPGPTPTTVWRMLPGRNAGELRGDGAYVLVPPSRLDGHGPYVRISGSLRTLVSIDDVAAYLGQVTSAFLTENPEERGPTLEASSRDILALNDEQVATAISRVKRLGLKKKILDTLLIPGNQDPGTRHWTQLEDASHSAIDFHVCCELVRKGWQFAEIEETFAATLVGDACYRNLGRANHGQGYLFRTFENARIEVEKEAQAARAAQGSNFRVLEVERADNADSSTYRLKLESTQGPPHAGFVTVTETELLNEREFVRACFKPPLSFIPEFAASQRGTNFTLFARAVAEMVSDYQRLPEASGRFQYLAHHARRAMERLADRKPLSKVDTSTLGWREGNDYFLRYAELVRVLRAHEHSLAARDAAHVLDALGSWTQFVQAWERDEPEQIIHLHPLSSA
jgi:hypothetical protein